MHTDTLIRMVNQIGTFFEAMPDRAEAVENVAHHLKRFWEPRMRRELLACIDAGGSAALNPMAAEALERHRKVLD